MYRVSCRGFWGCGWISLLLVISGCASRYHEPPASEKRAAYLEASIPVWIESIDDKKVSSIGILADKRLRISPGTHVVTVEYGGNEVSIYGTVYSSSTHAIRIKFVAIPGATYHVKDGRVGNHWQPYVTDTLEPKFSDPKLN